MIKVEIAPSLCWGFNNPSARLLRSLMLGKNTTNLCHHNLLSKVHQLSKPHGMWRIHSHKHLTSVIARMQVWEKTNIQLLYSPVRENWGYKRNLEIQYAVEQLHGYYICSSAVCNCGTLRLNNGSRRKDGIPRSHRLMSYISFQA